MVVSRKKLGIVAALLVGGLQLAAMIWGIAFVARQIRSAPSTFIDRINCISVEDVKYDAREFSDPELAAALTDILGIQTVLFKASYDACPWGLYLAAALEAESASRRDGSAVYAISSRICARSSDGAAKPDECISRRINTVTWRAMPHELFVSGLHALMLRQMGGADRNLK